MTPFLWPVENLSACTFSEQSISLADGEVLHGLQLQSLSGQGFVSGETSIIQIMGRNMQYKVLLQLSAHLPPINI